MREPTDAQVTAREHVQWLHREAGIPIAELARRMETSASRVSFWVNGHQVPSPMSAKRIEEVYQDELSRRQAN